jgi:protein gp37
LRWRDPRKIFVNSLSDVFHENIPFGYIAKIFAVMANAERHIFQILTKRPQVAKEWFETMTVEDVKEAAAKMGLDTDFMWPLPNVWLGVSTEDQETAEERIPIILECPAAIHWISAEPLLGPIDLYSVPDGLSWAVVGGESGPNARPMDAAWVEQLYRACCDKGIGFMFKQWGSSFNNPLSEDPTDKANGGKTKGGRTFRGKIWDQEPAQIIL